MLDEENLEGSPCAVVILLSRFTAMLRAVVFHFPDLAINCGICSLSEVNFGCGAEILVLAATHSQHEAGAEVCFERSKLPRGLAPTRVQED